MSAMRKKPSAARKNVRARSPGRRVSRDGGKRQPATNKPVLAQPSSKLRRVASVERKRPSLDRERKPQRPSRIERVASPGRRIRMGAMSRSQSFGAEFSLVDQSRESDKEADGSGGTITDQSIELETAMLTCKPVVNEVFQEWGEEVANQGISGLRIKFAELRSYVPASCTTNAFETNRTKNRYKDVLCMDDSRVCLKPGNAYIHASYVKNPPHSNFHFICTQAPLEVTVADFWYMVWQEKAPAIVMLCDLVENGKEKSVCYWPRKPGEVKEAGRFVITNRGMRCRDLRDEQIITCRLSLALKGHGGAIKVHHYMCPRWPDHGVPMESAATIHLLKLIGNHKQKQVVVHCSAGIGRTGTFAVLSFAAEMISQDRAPDCTQLLRRVRNQRLHSVQTELQFLFVHFVIIEFFTHERKQKISSKLQNFIQEYKAFMRRQLPI